MPQVFTNQTTNIQSAPIAWAGGSATVFVEGVFDEGAQLVIKCEKYGQIQSINHHLSWKSPGVEDYTLGACNLYFEIINAGPATNINAGYEVI